MLASVDRAVVTAHDGWGDLPSQLKGKLDLLWFTRENDWLANGEAADELDLLQRQQSEF